MKYAEEDSSDKSGLVSLFADTFSASEGPEEGALIGDLTDALVSTTPARDLRIFTAREGDILAGAIFFWPMVYANDDRSVMVLAPVAVRTDRQGKGVGEALIRKGLETLQRDGVDVAITYGDPAYYGRFGFRQVDTSVVAAPQPLSQPIGWMAQSLSDAPLAPLHGPVTCVPAFDKPDYW